MATGKDFRKVIKAAMDKASTVVIISSPDGDASQGVNYEAGLADALGEKVIMVHKKGTEQSALSHRFVDSANLIQMEDKAISSSMN